MENILKRVFDGGQGLAFAGFGLWLSVGIWGDTTVSFSSQLVICGIGLIFVIVGFIFLLAVMMDPLGKNIPENEVQESQKIQPVIQPQPAPTVNTVCPHCSSPIGKAEISPSGDVKCLYCSNWYNVRR